MKALLPLLLVATTALAEEGMWTLDNLPREALKADYGFEPDAAWVSNVQRSSVRLAGGCSGSFVSDNGLVLTNHHCVVHCAGQLSTAKRNLVEDGFVARTRAEEELCPDIEINQLIEITDVTERIQAVTAELEQAAANEARKAEMSRLEAECVGVTRSTTRCDVVTLYNGGLYHLYRYRRYQDVRLAFVPEQAIAYFGGDPDNFNFPRYNLDMALLRVYQDDQPAPTPDHFRFQPAGANEGELVFVTGHPGSTQRLLTTAQLASYRDLILPQRLIYLAELRGVLKQFSAQGREQARIANDDLNGVENSLKALRGRHQALVEPGFFAARQTAEDALRKQVQKKRSLRRDYGDAWEQIAAAQTTWRDIYTAYSFLEYRRGFQSELFAIARHLVRAAAERPKPDGERLREYTEAGLPRLTQQLFSSAPIYPELERLLLGWSLEKLREYLGADDPVVRRVLGARSPQQRADAAVDGSRLADITVRKALWEGGHEAVAASTDPMIVLAREVDEISRAVRKRYEDEVEAVEEQGGEKIARALFSIRGTDTYPDATFTLRLSYGQVQGWTEKGEKVLPFTTVGGAYARATGNEPYALPASWLDQELSLDVTTRMNMVTTHDIIGGNSGSPVINRRGEVVGLIFDGNIHSLGGAFAYDGRYNRAVSVHSAVMSEALRSIYDAPELLEELLGR